MPGEASEAWKVRSTSWLDRFKHFREMFSTAKDVYGDLLGVDFDSSVLLSLQLRSLLGVTRLVCAGIAGLPPGAIIDDVITDIPAFSAAIKKLLQDKNSQTKNVAIALPGSKVAVKQIKLEKKLSDDDAEARAWQEARKSFPELVKSLFLDFAQVEQHLPGNEKRYILMLVVARKEDVSPRVDALQQNGLTTKIVDVDCFSLERAYSLFASQLPEKHEEKYVALIDFNPQGILLVVMHQKKMVYHNRQAYAGDMLTPIVQRIMGVEMTSIKTNAPAFIQTPSDRPVDQPLPFNPQSQSTMQVETPQSVLNEDQKSHLVMTIRRLFQSFYAENPGRVIESIGMTGRCALIPEITQYVGKTLGVSLTVVNPLTGLGGSDSASMAPFLKLGPAFALCCGIAMRGIPLWK